MAMLSPSIARADVLTVWAAVKGVHTGGSSDLFVNLDSPVAAGVEAGVEVLGIDLFGEALLMGTDQYMFTANLGFDFSFGDDLRLDVGAFTGPMLFMFPAQDKPTGLRFDNLTAEEQSNLTTLAMAAGYASLDDLNSEFSMFSSQEEELGRTAFGWNIVRARVSVEYKLIPLLSIGAVGMAGYHLVITGDEVAAGAKNEAVTKFATENKLPDDATDLLRRAVGAEKVEKDKLNGINYNVGAFVKLEF